MVQSAVTRHFGARAASIDCLDIGCHEGFYSLAMARHGMKVTGMDAREENLNRARFVAEASGVRRAVSRRAAWKLWPPMKGARTT